MRLRSNTLGGGKGGHLTGSEFQRVLIELNRKCSAEMELHRPATVLHMGGVQQQRRSGRSLVNQAGWKQQSQVVVEPQEEAAWRPVVPYLESVEATLLMAASPGFSFRSTLGSVVTPSLGGWVALCIIEHTGRSSSKPAGVAEY